MSFDPKQPYNDLPLLPPPGDLETMPVLKKRCGTSTCSGNVSMTSTYRPNMSRRTAFFDMFLKHVHAVNTLNLMENPGGNIVTTRPLSSSSRRSWSRKSARTYPAIRFDRKMM